MSRSLSTLLVFLILLCLRTAILPQQLNFTQLGTDQGLSQSSVRAIIQDQHGFMWFGTEDGLNRYDGYTFKVYRSSPTNPQSLCSNWINRLMEDESGLIWIGTPNGLSVLNPETEQFFSFFASASDSTSLTSSLITALFQDNQSNIFVGTNNGLNRLNPSSTPRSEWKFEPFPNSDSFNTTGPKGGIIQSICEDAFGRIWFSAQQRDVETSLDTGALNSFNPSDRSFKQYYHQPENSNSLSSSAVKSVFFDSFGTLWVGTVEGGLNRIHFDENGTFHKVRRFLADTGDPSSIPHKYINKITQDKNETIWVATYDGIARFLPKTQSFQSFRYDAKNSTSIAAPHVLDLMADQWNNLWITTGTGLSIHFPRTKKFRNYLPDKENTNTIINGDIFGMLEDSDGEVWCASYGSGLSRIIPQSGGKEKVVSYSTSSHNTSILPTNHLLDIKQAPDNTIWLATFGGLLKISKKSGSDKILLDRFLPTDDIKTSLSSPYFLTTNLHSANGFIAKTYRSGIDRISFNNKTLVASNIAFIGLEEVDSLKILPESTTDNRGEAWIITPARLFFVKDIMATEPTSTPVVFDNIKWRQILAQDIKSIFRSEANTLWLGTTNGLAKATFSDDPGTGNVDTLHATVRFFTDREGLPNNTIYAIESDNKGNLWMSTNKGLSKFSPIENTFRNFDVSDGLFGNEFNEQSVTKGHDGTLYFAGIKGFVKFHPDSITDNPHAPPVKITRLQIMNNTVAFDPAGESYLKQPIETTKELTLSHRDYYVTLEFSALNFNSPEKNQYEYKLEGFHDEWIHLGHQRQATFTNLNSGTYIFRVRGSNNDGVWSSEETTLKIRVLPPPWKSWWAYTAYLLLAVALLFVYTRSHRKKLDAEVEVKLKIAEAKREERERVRKRTSQDFHDEAGNRLTRINLISEVASQKYGKNKELQEYLEKIKQNTRELSSGMRDFLWTLDTEKDTLLDLVERLESFGNAMFQYTDTRFLVEARRQTFNEVGLPMELQRSILLIFKEAMNNVLKYAAASVVSLTIKSEEAAIFIELSDDGKGFELPASGDGYGIKNMTARAKKINGSFSLQTNEGQGTKITLILSLPQSDKT
ncbi:MAG: two-component regulator propeller domain-containing protein [Calditrichia bacterium]